MTRITRILKGFSTPVPIVEESYKMLVNNTVTVWISENPNPENKFLIDIWNIVEKEINVRSNFKKLTTFNYEEAFNGDHRKDIYWYSLSDYSTEKLLMPFFKTWYEVYMKKPSRSETSAFYVNNFPLTAWIMQLIMIAVLLPTMFWITFYLYKKFSLEKRRLAISDCMMQVLSLITNQGQDQRTMTTCMRLLRLTIMLFGYLIIAWYAALLVASQAISKEAPLFSSLDDIIRIRTHQLCVENGSWAQDTFRETMNSSSKYRPEWRHLINGPGCPRDPSHLHPTCDHDIASYVKFKHFTTNGGVQLKKCVVMPFKEKYHNDPALLVVGEGFPKKKAIDKVLTKLRNRGIVNYLWVNSRHYVRPEEINLAEVPHVSIGHVEGVFLAYFICISLAILVLVVETLMHRTLSRIHPVDREKYGPNSLPFIN